MMHDCDKHYGFARSLCWLEGRRGIFLICTSQKLITNKNFISSSARKEGLELDLSAVHRHTTK